MPDSESRTPISSRPWELIARELSVEMNSEKILELSLELSRALDEQGLDGGPRGRTANNDPTPMPDHQSRDYY